MAFDLYFAGSGTDKVFNYKIDLGVCQLFSQLNERKDILKWIDTNKEIKGKLFIDSGAWTAHSKGKEVDVNEYISFINKYDDFFTIYAQVDKIPGEFRKPKTRQQILEAPEISWQNYLYMKDKVKSRDKLIPVFHQGEDFKWLKNMLEYTHSDNSHIKYIGISPANDSPIPGKILFVDKCFEIIKNSSNPNVKTHAFGMTKLDVLEHYPFTSADSTRYLMYAINGLILSKFGSIDISDRRFKKTSGLFNKGVSELEKEINEYGFTLKELTSSIENRSIYNIVFLKNWADNYKYKPLTIKNNNLF